MSTIFDKIRNLYTVDTYYSKYGGSVIFAFFIVVIAVSLISYFTMQSQLFKLRMENAEGNLDKCSPLNIPIYGNILNAQPAPGQSQYSKNYEETANNLNQCTNKFLSELMNVLMQPIYVTLGIIVGNIDAMKSFINSNGGIVKMLMRLFHIIIEIILSVIKGIIYGIADMLNSVLAALVQGGSTLDSVLKWSSALYSGVFVFGWKAIYRAMNDAILALAIILILSIVLAWVLLFSWQWVLLGTLLAIIIIVIIVVMIILIVIQASGYQWAERNGISMDAVTITPPKPYQVFQCSDWMCPNPALYNSQPGTIRFYGMDRTSPTVKYTGDLRDVPRQMGPGTWNLGQQISTNALWEKAKPDSEYEPNIWTQGYPKIYKTTFIGETGAATVNQYGTTGNRSGVSIDGGTESSSMPYLFGPLQGYRKMVILTGVSGADGKGPTETKATYSWSPIIDIANSDTMIPNPFMETGVGPILSNYLTNPVWEIGYVQGSGREVSQAGLVIAQFKNPTIHSDIKDGSGLLEAEKWGYIYTKGAEGPAKADNVLGPTYIMISKGNPTSLPDSTKLQQDEYNANGDEEWVRVMQPLGGMMGGIEEEFHIHLPGPVPPTLAQYRFRNFANTRVISACFGEETIIPLEKGSTTINNVKSGDRLVNGDVITGTFKIDALGHSVCNINGIKVSSNHKIWTDKDNWVMASDYPNSKECEYNKPYLYSLNTTSKKLILNDIEFADWDEIMPGDIAKIKNNCSDNVPKNLKSHHLHKYLDGGFAGDTLCTLKDKSVRRISELNIDDELLSGEKIKCLVEIDASQYKTLKLLKGKTTDIVCGPNVRYTENDNRNMTTLDLDESILNKNKKEILYSKLYHVITTTKTITIDGITCYDYDGCLDKIIEN